MLTIEEIKAGIEQVKDKYPIKKVELFGSYANGNQDEDSDIDLLVEYQDVPYTLLTISGLKISLEDIYGLKVDLVTSPLKKDSFLEIPKKVLLYEA